MTTLVATGAAAAAVVSVSGATQAHADSVWDRVAQCESGGNWNTNTGNGFKGGLQFTSSTWRAYGGSGAAHNASKSEQIRVAKNVLKGQGPGAWPVCSKRAGLTRGNGGSASAEGATQQRASRSAERPAAVQAQPKKVYKQTRKAETKSYAPKAETKSYAPKAETKSYAPKAETKSYAPKASTKSYVKKQRVAAPALPSVKASDKTVTVTSGDTLAKLADKHGVDSWRQLWAANSKTVQNPNLIFVGQVLHLPA